jgi:hypothetical protein
MATSSLHLTIECRANKPARVAQLDDGNDRAILVKGDKGSAQVIRLGHLPVPQDSAAVRGHSDRTFLQKVRWQDRRQV